MVTWEYLVTTINTEYQTDREGNIEDSPDGEEILQERLAEYGRDGWELVAFLPAAPAKHFKGNPQNPWVVFAIFKRARQS